MKNSKYICANCQENVDSVIFIEEKDNDFCNNCFDADELKTDFNEYLYSKGYDFEAVTEFSDEHFQNLISFEKNEINFKKFISNENK